MHLKTHLSFVISSKTDAQTSARKTLQTRAARTPLSQRWRQKQRGLQSETRPSGSASFVSTVIVCLVSRIL